MIIHEINTRNHFHIEVGTSREDFTVTYTENISKESERKMYVDISFDSEQVNFFTKNKVVNIHLDSFEKWENPKDTEVRLDEYQTILFRVFNFFSLQGYKVQLKS